MSSAAKTLELLAYFTIKRPEIGLSEMCRLAHRDKATTHRHLQALEETGFVEQNQLTKRYRLGPLVLQLAQTREATVPRKAGALPALKALANATGETAHVSVLSGTTLYPLASIESPKHSTRAIIDIQTFPLHATASGLCALAFGPDDLFDAALRNMTNFTTKTVTSKDGLQACAETIRDTGFSVSDRTFDNEVYSLSTPVFGPSGLFAGAVSVASVATRFDPDLDTLIRQNLILASHEVTHNWGGVIPEELLSIWDQPQTRLHKMEPVL